MPRLFDHYHFVNVYLLGHVADLQLENVRQGHANRTLCSVVCNASVHNKDVGEACFVLADEHAVLANVTNGRVLHVPLILSVWQGNRCELHVVGLELHLGELELVPGSRGDVDC